MAYRVIITQGLRGTEAYPAESEDGARAIVRRILAGLAKTDKHTAYERINPDLPTAWRVTAGKFKGDTLQIVQADGAKPAVYNTQAIVNSLDREAKKEQADRHVRQTQALRKMDQGRAAKRAVISVVKPCKACGGHGNKLVTFQVVQPNFPAIGHPLTEAEIYAVTCTACAGLGKEEGRETSRAANMERAHFNIMGAIGPLFQERR